MSKKTIVLGASTNPSRYSNIATHRLVAHGHEVIPIGIKKGTIADIPIQNELLPIREVDTVTLYLNPKRQEQYYEYILRLNPRRVIFNPGTENPVLVALLKEKGIEAEIACTLVLLNLGAY